MDLQSRDGFSLPLLPPQAEVLARDLLGSGFSCVLQMPTGSGKTWLAEKAIEDVLASGARAVYLTPLRALATELMGRWQDRFANYKVGVFTGDYGRAGNPYPVPFREAQVLVMTPERLDACTRFWRHHWSWIPEVDVVVVDEIHLLGDPSRGPRLEGTLSRFRRLNPFARIIGLSATLGNRHELADWLDGVDYHSEWRPVPLEWRIARFRKATEKPDLLVDEVARNVQAGGKSLVFVQSRRRAEELSRHVQGAGLRAHHHHAGLQHPERRRVENGFRDDDTDVLVATSTLEMGLNLPVRQVVLYDLQMFNGTDFRPLPANSVWQRVGRAGRPGLDTKGEAVLLAPTWDREAKRYPNGDFEPILSGLSDSRALAEQIVAEVASGLARTASQLESVFDQSLAAMQLRLPQVDDVITEMCDAGMLTEGQDSDTPHAKLRLKATHLGHIASRHFLAPATVLLFRRVREADDSSNLTFLDVLIVAASNGDAEPVIPVDFEELDALAADLAHEPSVLLRLPRDEIVRLLGVTGKRLLSSLKMSLILRAWTRVSDASHVAERYGCYAFEIHRLRESFSRLLLAMASVHKQPAAEKDEQSTFNTDIVPLAERIRILQRMVASGLDEYAATLTLVHGIGPEWAKRLQGVNIADIEDLALGEPTDLLGIRGIASNRATAWIDHARELIKTRYARRYRENEPTPELPLANWPSEVDPYRLRRALDLIAVRRNGRTYLVTGGLEPHIVRIESTSFVCDCADADKGNLCKHVLAIRLDRGDPMVSRLVRRLGSQRGNDKLDLFELWFEG